MVFKQKQPDSYGNVPTTIKTAPEDALKSISSVIKKSKLLRIRYKHNQPLVNLTHLHYDQFIKSFKNCDF